MKTKATHGATVKVYGNDIDAGPIATVRCEATEVERHVYSSGAADCLRCGQPWPDVDTQGGTA